MKYIITILVFACYFPNQINAQEFQKFNDTQEFRKYGIAIGFRMDKIFFEPINKEIFDNSRTFIEDSYGGGIETVLTYNKTRNLSFQLIPSTNLKQTKFEFYELPGKLTNFGDSGIWTTSYLSFESDLLIRYTIPINVLSINLAAGINGGLLGRNKRRAGHTSIMVLEDDRIIRRRYISNSRINRFHHTGGFTAKASLGIANNRVEITCTYNYNLRSYNKPEVTDFGLLEEFVDDLAIFQGSAHRLGFGMDIRLY